jgi:energy-coupling factor transporter ATP-binding protein EcfA2
VTFHVEPGEMALLIGPTGCGKSTVCLCTNGMIPHTVGGKLTGQVIVNGKDVARTDVRDLSKEVALVFQNPDEQLTCLYVDDEVAFGPENLKLDEKEILDRIDSSLKYTGLSSMSQKIVYDLSGGQKQRLAIAAVLSMRPDILVFDSPTSNLDPQGASEILSVLDRIRTEHSLTALVVEHKIDGLIALADRLIVMNHNGHVIMNSTPREVMTNALQLRDEHGLWIPQISEFALEMRKRGFEFEQLPLTVEEATKIMARLSRKGEPPQIVLEKETGRIGIEPVISVTNAVFTYPDGTQAIKGISFEIMPGEFATIVGQNGSGKTTMAYNLMGLLKSTSGSIRVLGKHVHDLRVHEVATGITYVFQYPEHQFVEEQVSKEIEFELMKKHLSKEDLRVEVKKVLTDIGLYEFRDQSPYNLSVGQKRILSAAMMTLADPKVIILDEPTYGQDRWHNYSLMDYMRNLNKQGTTVVMITHDMRLVAEYASRVLAMSDGHLVYDGPVREFFRNGDLVNRLQLLPPPVTELSMKLFGVPALKIDELCERFALNDR